MLYFLFTDVSTNINVFVIYTILLRKLLNFHYHWFIQFSNMFNTNRFLTLFDRILVAYCQSLYRQFLLGRFLWLLSTQNYWISTATALRLRQPYHGTGKRFVAFSWFCSVKCVSELMKRGLFSFMLVTRTYGDFNIEILGETALKRSGWVAFSTTKDDVKL